MADIAVPVPAAAVAVGETERARKRVCDVPSAPAPERTVPETTGVAVPAVVPIVVQVLTVRPAFVFVSVPVLGTWIATPAGGAVLVKAVMEAAAVAVRPAHAGVI